MINYSIHNSNLNEKIALRKTVTRLSRNPDGFDDGDALFEEYLKKLCAVLL